MDCVKAPTSIHFVPSLLPELSLKIIHCVFAANTNKPNAFSILRNTVWHSAHPLTTLQSAKCQQTFQDAVGIRKLNCILLG